MSHSYIRSLLTKGAAIQQAIERESRAPRPDWMRLLQLKKLRLAITDRLHRLGASLGRQDRLTPAHARATSRNN